MENIMSKKTNYKASRPAAGRNTAGKGTSVLPVKEGFNKLLIPYIIVIAVVPLIVFLKAYNPGLQDYNFFTESEYAFDLFLYWKGFVLVLCAIAMAGILIWCTLKNKIKLRPEGIYIPLAGYVLLALLSSIFSKNPELAFFGSYEQFESFFVLMGYGIVTYYASLIISSQKDLDTITVFLTISTVIMLLLGIGQAFSADFFRTPFFASIASLGLPSKLSAAGSGTLDFTFEKGRVYLTLYNPNYVGSYVALLAPVFLTLAIAKKKLPLIILNMAIFVGLLLTVLGSGSRAGFAGIIISFLLLVVLFNKKLKKYWMEALIVLTLLVGTAYTMNNYSNNAIWNRVKNAFSFEAESFPLADIAMDGAKLTVVHNDSELIINYGTDENSSYYFSLEDSTAAPVYATQNEEGWFIPDDSRYAGISVGSAPVSGYPGLVLKIDGKLWAFAYDNNELYYLNYLGRLTKIQESETFEPLSNISKFASGRGYIWSKTIPLLKDNIILGSGPDTFLLQYPNEDYVDRTNHGCGEELTTKPHNLYLQIGVQTGVVSLLCFLVFYFWYFIFTVKIIRKSDKSKPKAILGIGILCGTFGYMIVGLINDSTVAVAPLFWALTGMGIAIDFMLKKELPEQTEVKDTASGQEQVTSKA